MLGSEIDKEINSSLSSRSSKWEETGIFIIQVDDRVWVCTHSIWSTEEGAEGGEEDVPCDRS